MDRKYIYIGGSIIIVIFLLGLGFLLINNNQDNSVLDNKIVDNNIVDNENIRDIKAEKEFVKENEIQLLGEKLLNKANKDNLFAIPIKEVPEIIDVKKIERTLPGIDGTIIKDNDYIGILSYGHKLRSKDIEVFNKSKITLVGEGKYILINKGESLSSNNLYTPDLNIIKEKVDSKKIKKEPFEITIPYNYFFYNQDLKDNYKYTLKKITKKDINIKKDIIKIKDLDIKGDFLIFKAKENIDGGLFFINNKKKERLELSANIEKNTILKINLLLIKDILELKKGDILQFGTFTHKEIDNNGTLNFINTIEKSYEINI